MQRFVDILEHFDPKIIYRPGRGNTLTDWLSRPPDTLVFATLYSLETPKPKLLSLDSLL